MPKRRYSDAVSVFKLLAALPEAEQLKFDLLREGAALANARPDVKPRAPRKAKPNGWTEAVEARA